MDTKITSKKRQGEQIFITRDFDAPRSLVFKAWTDCGWLMSWWGPKGFTTPLCNIDFRPKGHFHYCMRSPEGKDYCGKGVYREIVEPERITYTDFFVDEKGNPVPPSHYGISPEWPQEALVTVKFAEHDGMTRLTLQHSVGSVPDSERDMCQQGWTEMLDKLAEEVARA